MVVFAKKVQTIIRRYLLAVLWAALSSQHDIQQTFPVQPSRRRPQEHIPDRGARGVKRSARRQPGRGAGGGRPPISSFPGRPGHADPGHVKMERGEGSGGGHPPVDPFNGPNLDIPSFNLGLTQPSQLLPSGTGTLHVPPLPGLGFAPFQSPACDNVYTLRINNKSCNCGKWQTYTLPCSHVLAVCRENGSRADAYVPEIYSRQTYRRTYHRIFIQS
ncbi:hypothetical protein M9H77_02302 [Catharanthus roseus]|uniref:Uncharacterized protein n=1 Tax=Catharanthus roseus TaxID=4058 RepID=A0ACC0C844_CATRO|nr:hypothetical protein M9H77_02302 [Catharanthus roseus]